MKCLLFTSLLWLASDPSLTVAVLRARYAYLRETRPALPDSLTRGANASAGEQLDNWSAAVRWTAAAPEMPPVRELIVYSLPFEQCPPCRALYENVGEGDASLRLTWVKQNWPAWVTVAPTVFDPRGNRYRTGATTLDQLRQWVGLPPRAALAATPPVLVGELSEPAAFRALVDTLQHLLGPANGLRVERGGTVSLGRVEVVFPSPTVLRWDARTATKRCVFEGAKPRLRGWGVDVPVDAVSYDGTAVTLHLPGWPDWTLRVGSPPDARP
jgi:hypothetical protein